MKKFRVLDLFAGCGGMSLGFEHAGFDIVLGIDSWEEALVTFKNNHKKSATINADLASFNPESLLSKYTDIDVIIGGPPCQGFSISGKRNPNDSRNKLYQSFVAFVEHIRPKAFIMENVPNLVSMNEGKVKEQIIKEFNDLGYNVTYKILMASDFDIPQNRKRVFFVGMREGREFVFPDSDKARKVPSADAISDLPDEELKDGVKYPCLAKSSFQSKMRKGSRAVFNHQITKHTDKTKEIINMVPDGGNYKTLPASLHRTRKVNIAWTRLNSMKPSFTIDTGHNHHFHYSFNRVPTARESARLQSFPDTFIFYGTKNEQLKQVGNAVPPMLAEVIARQLIKYL